MLLKICMQIISVAFA